MNGQVPAGLENLVRLIEQEIATIVDGINFDQYLRATGVIPQNGTVNNGGSTGIVPLIADPLTYPWSDTCQMNTTAGAANNSFCCNELTIGNGTSFCTTSDMINSQYSAVA